MATNPQILNVDRIADYTPGVLTTDFVVGWPIYFSDGEDPAADLAVVVSGTELATSDFTLVGNPISGLSGVYNGGTVSLHTGINAQRVIIYSRRDPRRVGFYLEGKSLPFTELDKLQNDFAVMMRDLDLRTKRAITVPLQQWLDGVDPDGLAQSLIDAGALAGTVVAAVATLVSGVVPRSVKSATTASQPGSPSVGDAYVVPAGGWSGLHATNIALYTGVWTYLPAVNGLQVFAQDTKLGNSFDGTVWKADSKVVASRCATLAAAVTAAAASGADLEINLPCTITAPLSIPAAIKAVYFTGTGRISGTYSVTFNGNDVVAPGVQIFALTGGGVILGTINCSICPDWWGTTSTSTADAATTNAGNASFAYMQQSANPSAEWYLTKPAYFLNSSWIKAESYYCPQIDGRGATIWVPASNSGLIITGGSGAVARSKIINLYFDTAAASANGLEIRGQCGLDIDGIGASVTINVGIVLHNYSAGSFTEHVVWRNCSFRSKYWWYYKRTSGNDSFHGSGPDGANVCNDTTGIANARILVDPNCVVYNHPQSFTAFATTSVYPLISVGTGSKYLPNRGTIGIENAGYTGTLIILSGGAAAAGAINVTDFGGDWDPGDMVLMQTLDIQGDGVIRGIRKGFKRSKAGTGTSTAILLSSGPMVASSFLLNVFINLTNYFWKGTVQVTTDPFGGAGAGGTVTLRTGGASYGSWGAPTFSWDGNSLTVTNASFPAGGAISVAATDLGDFF